TMWSKSRPWGFVFLNGGGRLRDGAACGDLSAWRGRRSRKGRTLHRVVQRHRRHPTLYRVAVWGVAQQRAARLGARATPDHDLQSLVAADARRARAMIRLGRRRIDAARSARGAHLRDVNTPVWHEWPAFFRGVDTALTDMDRREDWVRR